HHDAAREERSEARRRRRHDAYAELDVVALERDLVDVLVRSDLDRLELADTEVVEDGGLRLLVHAPVAVDLLGDSQLPAGARGEGLLGAHNSSAARLHSSSVGTSAKRT